MRRVFKIIGVILGILVALVIVVGIATFFITRGRLNKTYDVQVAAVEVPQDDEDAVARGQHIFVSFGTCAECHGANGGGDTIVDDAFFAHINAPNLTTGEGGIGAELSDEDIVRALRHGVNREGHAIPFMPSEAYYYYDDADIGAIIAYVRSLEPVDNIVPDEISFSVIGNVYLAIDEYALPAQVIEHDVPPPPAPEPGVTIEYGRHLARFCEVCHGRDDLAGGDPGPNLTSSGNLGDWAEEEFITALRSGRTPDGRDLNPDDMPWQSFGLMSDDELGAIWLFLQSLPPG